MAKKGAIKSSGGGSSSSESNTGLVVSLVIFIILAIGLGVTTYLGYAGQEDYRKQAADEKKKADDANKKANSEAAQKLALKLAIGQGVADAADKTAFSGLKGGASSDVAATAGKVSESLAAKLRELSDMVPKFKSANAKWDVAGSDTPPKSYTGLIDDLRDAIKDMQAKQAAGTTGFNEEKGTLTNRIQELEGKLDESQKALKKAHDDLVRTQNEKAVGSDALNAKVKELSEQVVKIQNEKDNQFAELSAESKRQQQRIDTMAKVREQFKSRVGPILEKLEKIKLERPEIRELAELHELLLKQFESAISVSNEIAKGSIIKMDRVNNLAYVNLGRADNVRPGVTFAVLPAGSTGKAAASRERKGAIEVIEVLEDHLSTAKVLEAVNASRDPLLPGDLLFNPAWNPNQRTHVALAGIIDINGDGIDDTPDLIRMLERQGVVVDAFLDLKDRTVKGPGITERTEYLIYGEKPLISAVATLEANPVTQAALDVMGKMEEMKKKATDLGAQPVQFRRFLLLMGYKLPKGVDTSDISASSYLRGTQTKGKDDSTTPKDDKPK
jgi:predicted  nucleic acid-binding Zn-ribbon protein